jgi:hypothetical protein
VRGQKLKKSALRFAQEDGKIQARKAPKPAQKELIDAPEEPSGETAAQEALEVRRDDVDRQPSA